MNSANGIDEIDELNNSKDYHVSSMNEEECETLLKPYMDDQKLYNQQRLCHDCKQKSGVIQHIDHQEPSSLDKYDQSFLVILAICNFA